MPLRYNFDIDAPDELLAILAGNLQKRRLEKGLSREALTQLSGVPTPTIAKFEQKHTISLASYVALAKALGYSDSISGGCRPKCLLHDSDGSWLVKFRHTYDPKDVGIMEYRYNEIARRCGITVPDFKLMDGKYSYYSKERYKYDFEYCGRMFGNNIQRLYSCHNKESDEKLSFLFGLI